MVHYTLIVPIFSHNKILKSENDRNNDREERDGPDGAQFFLPGMEETNDFTSVESQRSRLNSEKFQSKLSMKMPRIFHLHDLG